MKTYTDSEILEAMRGAAPQDVAFSVSEWQERLAGALPGCDMGQIYPAIARMARDGLIGIVPRRYAVIPPVKRPFDDREIYRVWWATRDLPETQRMRRIATMNGLSTVAIKAGVARLKQLGWYREIPSGAGFVPEYNGPKELHAMPVETVEVEP